MKSIGVVGGGIVGLAIAYKLQLRYKGVKVLLFEKELQLGQHQSGRNSGVLHCGLYYEPGSLKAKLAVAGIQQMTAFCQSHDIAHEICGKVVVASNKKEELYLENLADRGRKNGLQGLRFLTSEELKSREPFVAATAALSIADYVIEQYL